MDLGYGDMVDRYHSIKFGFNSLDMYSCKENGLNKRATDTRFIPVALIPLTVSKKTGFTVGR